MTQKAWEKMMTLPSSTTRDLGEILDATIQCLEECIPEITDPLKEALFTELSASLSNTKLWFKAYSESKNNINTANLAMAIGKSSGVVNVIVRVIGNSKDKFTTHLTHRANDLLGRTWTMLRRDRPSEENKV